MLKIGVSSCFFHPNPIRPIFKNKTLLYFEESIVRMILYYGAIPLVLPRKFANISTRDILKQVDGLLLQGGSDVCPISYGEKAIKSEWNGDEERDKYEIELIQEAMIINKPVFGICRGLQVLNVALGGSLYQDIETQIKGASLHRNWKIYEKFTHDILIEPNTYLKKLYPSQKAYTIISIHHQTVKKLGEGLIIEARSKEDNLIESIRYRDKGDDIYACAVQWHPEFQNLQDSSLMDHRPMIKDYLKAVENRKK